MGGAEVAVGRTGETEGKDTKVPGGGRGQETGQDLVLNTAAETGAEAGAGKSYSHNSSFVNAQKSVAE